MGLPARPAHVVKTPYLAAALVVVITVAALVSGFVWAKKGITVVVDGESAYHRTGAATVGAALAELGVALGEHDVVSPPVDAAVTDALTVVVRHAVPVTLDCNGEKIDVQVVGSTVADALVAVGIDPSLGVSTIPRVETSLVPRMSICVKDVFLRIAQEVVDLPYKTVEESDASLAWGTRVVRTTGKVGTALRVYKVLVTSGVEGQRFVASEQMIAPPIDRVVAVGAKRTTTTIVAALHAPTLPAPKVAAPPAEGTPVAVVSTAYTPWDPGCGGISVIERRLRSYRIPAGWGIVAVDPAVFPLGTRMYVPGYGYAVAADIGGAIVGKRIDVCFWAGGESVARRTALTWGRRAVTVLVVK